jgi:glyoxylase-like metal-dependent hydrolase (beta-lactamase superfamily II)
MIKRSDQAAAKPIPNVHAFYEEHTFSLQYIVWCPQTKHCAIIDPVFDYDERSGATSTASADLLLDFITERGLHLEWILDTHPHADHISGAAYLKARTGAPIAIGARITEVQTIWQSLYAWPELRCDGSQWDRLFAHGDTFAIGELAGRVIHSPGHTLASATYLIGDAAFIHDTLFMPDTGTARTDFPGGSARDLYESIQAILALPDSTRLFTGHDYREGGRDVQWESTVGEQKLTNIHWAARPSREAFVAMRESRDSRLPMPRLILHALQANLQAGRLPEPDAQGRRFFKIPLDALRVRGTEVPKRSHLIGGR